MTPPYETSTAAAAYVSSLTETAGDWYQRSSQRHNHHHPLGSSSCVGNITTTPSTIPTDPWGHRTARVATTTTGIAFVDAALKSNRTSSGSSSMVLEVRGDSGSGKTWTLISLAAHHVVATRPWRWDQTPNKDTTRNDNSMDTTTSTTTTTTPVLPQVFVLDSGLDITPTKLAYAVRSCLLRASNHDATNHPTPNNNEEEEYSSSVPFFQRDMQDCLSRIHVAAGVTDWVPVLESIRHAMRSWQPQPQQPPSFGHEQQPQPPPHSTLLLWDGFLPRATGIGDDDVAHMEVLRQVTRLVVPEINDDWSNGGGGVALVVATRMRLPPAWERLVTHHIRLEQLPQQQQQQHSQKQPAVMMGHAYMATVHGTRIPFSISLSGILS